jgi:RHS repeat-associated protein
MVTVSGLASNGVRFTPLPSGWLDQDIGNVGAAGSIIYAGGVFTVKGAGVMSGTTDAFHFVYQTLSGDGTIVARLVNSLTSGYAAVMIRETTAQNSSYASTYYLPNSFQLLYRNGTGTGANGVTGGSMATPPYWLKLTRSGNSFTGYESLDGSTWTQISNVSISMATNVYIGLAVDSETSGTLQTATFDNVSIDTPPNPAPVISSVTATTGSIGSSVTINGSHFGPSQGSSVVALNASPMTVNSWSDTSITITIASGAASGYLGVQVGPSMNASNPIYFTITSQPLPSGWLDQDIGNVGAIGSATYSNGVFTVNGEGGISSTHDASHFVYQTLSGDGTIIARVVSVQSNSLVTVMVRETTSSNSTFAASLYIPNEFGMWCRSSLGGGINYQASGPSAATPYWLKVTRSGNSFTGYGSLDGTNWTQIGTPVTVSMATNVYIGLTAGSSSSSTLQTATFDNVSVSSNAFPAPVISSVSATTGTVGSQVVINGFNFGTSQGSSLVMLNTLPMSINSWSSTSITATIASGATSGYLGVQIGPSMNASNPVYFTVTSQPLPSGWLDMDIGNVGAAGSATFSSGVFTVKGAGALGGGTSESFHLVYQTLTGDGTIVARVVSSPPTSFAAVMIRETNAANSSYASTSYVSGGFQLYVRNGAGTSIYDQSSGPAATAPYWLKVTRRGNSFTGYGSLDGTYWTQIGTPVTVSMATNVYIGLAVSSETIGTLQTTTFDNVSISSGAPLTTPNISGVTPNYGGASTSVTINGSNFGTSQGSSSVLFNGSLASSTTSWSATQIVAVVPSTASTGPVSVVVNGLGSNENFTFSFFHPVISSLSPPFGPVGGSIVVNGSGFGSTQDGLHVSSTVQFNGINASVTSWSDTQVTATVPASVTTGPVTITENTVTTNGATFTIIEAASITGVSPGSGRVGASIVITGTGFGPTQSDSTVTFAGGTATTITNWSDTSITATVPTGAFTGQLYVDVAGQVALGPTFYVTSNAVVTDSLGNSTSYTSEIVGAKWATVQSQGSGCSSCSMRGNNVNTFDSNGNLLISTDPNGNTTTYTYDSSNDLLTQSMPLNSSATATTTYTYNSLGEVLTVTDPLGHVTTNTYDTHGNLLTVTAPAPGGGPAASVTTFTYNSLGELLTITDPLSHVTTMTYTTAGLIHTITDAQSNVTTYAYDSKGNRTSVTDALSHVTTFAYDSMSRLTTITYPDSTTSTFAYDSRGRRTSVTDQNGKATTYAYDDADRLTSVTDAASHVTYYAYDTESNLTSIQDASSNTTAFTYDAYGRVTNTNFPSSLSETYAYDADNNLTSKTDRKSQTITYLYDALNRLTSKTYPDMTAVDYTYDLVGKITQVNDPTGTYALAYDNMGRLIGTTTSYSFLTGRNFTNAYTYDAASNRTGFTDPESGSTSYSYDTLNRLTSLAPPSAFGSGSFGFSYDALSRRTQMTRPNSVATNYTYDTLSRLTSVLHQLSGSTIDGASYTLDSAGNRTAKVDQRAAVTSNYTYDAIYQLTQTMQGTSTTESYSYDPVSNRTASLGVSSYSTNVSNEMTANSNASYTYDSNGNTVTKTVGSNTTTYAWDYENRLTSVTLPGSGGTVTFKYDPLGRRIEKVSPTFTSIFGYDGDNLIEETNASGGVVARYTQTQNIDQPLAMFRSSATSYYDADGLGSVTSLTNASGAAAETYTYDSFGNVTASSGSLTNPFQYTGREFDSETGLYFYRARYFDPTAGKFLSEDPTGFAAGVEFYCYVWNSATNLSDPLGLFPRGWHYGVTLALARAVFGPKCIDAAKAVADSDASVDNFGYGIGPGVKNSVKGFLLFLTHGGPGWAQPGPHFPTGAMLDQLHTKAMQTCSAEALGESLHSLQDSWAHSGWSSFDHFTHLTSPDTDAANDAGTADAAMIGTISQLQEFKQNCLKCCQ